MSQTEVGKILAEDAERDAIHVAVLPAYASVHLRVGDSVDLDDYGKAEPVENGKGIGIVDPFLKSSVLKGQRFYIFLYPNSITSMKHTWTCPSIDNRCENEYVQTLKKYAEKFEMSVDDLVQHIVTFSQGGEPLCLPFDTPDFNTDLYDAVEMYAGRSVKEKIEERVDLDFERPFRCAC